VHEGRCYWGSRAIVKLHGWLSKSGAVEAAVRKAAAEHPTSARIQGELGQFEFGKQRWQGRVGRAPDQQARKRRKKKKK